MEVIFIIGIAQAVFFSIFLLTKKGNKIANRLLTALLLLISFSLFINYTYITGLILKIPHFVGLDATFDFLYPPIIFLYTRALVSKDTKFQSFDILHLIPFISHLTYVMMTFYMESETYKVDFLMELQRVGMPLDLAIANYIKNNTRIRVRYSDPQPNQRPPAKNW